jgi:hypothetical protein
MPIVGEMSDTFGAWTYGTDGYVSILELNFPPTNCLVRAVLGDVLKFTESDAARASVFLDSIRRRRPDGSDETITFPRVAFTDAATRSVWYDPAMTNVRLGIFVFNAGAVCVWTLEVWD